jgi:predicted phage gp36 major capsid-like protein
MANAIPLLEGTDPSGGYLVRDTYGETLQNTVRREGPALSLSRVDRVPGKRQKYTVYAGRPTAAFVDEGAAKGVTGAEFAEVVVNIKKIATTVLYTDELLEDAVEDPRVLVNADVETAFGQLIDAHIAGWSAGAAITTQFDSAWRGTTSTVEVDLSKADGIPLAVSAGMEIIEANGGQPSGLLLASDARATFRNARQSASGLGAASPLYSQGFEREPDSLYRLAIAYSSNLPTVAGAAAAGRHIGYVGDFSHSVVAMRQDITVRSTNEATVDVGGTLHHLWQQNKTAVQWEMRLGHVDHDANRMIVALLNAA